MFRWFQVGGDFENVTSQLSVHQSESDSGTFESDSDDGWLVIDHTHSILMKREFNT